MDFTVIAHAVEVDHGVKRLSMRFIKRYAAPERARLSVELCERISAALEELDLITVPRRLPTSENEYVFVVHKQSPIGEAVLIASAVAMMERLGTPAIPNIFDHFPQARHQLT